MRSLLIATLTTLALAAASPDPVAWKALDAPETPLKPGARFTVRLVGQIQEGWHMYSMRPVADGPIPTRVWIAEGQPVVLAGNVKASTPQNVRDTSFDMEVEQYEGQAEFILPLRVKASVNDQVLKLPVHASYQTCNNKICLPPKTVTIEVPITITR